VHIEPFEKQGKWFARCPEFDLVAHGDTSLDAARNLFNMMLRSVVVAKSMGNLERILKRAGVQTVTGVPEDAMTGRRDALWFLPLIPDARPGSAA
jgi:hypothetical protein